MAKNNQKMDIKQREKIVPDNLIPLYSALNNSGFAQHELKHNWAWGA
jgi:hypothetical protein